jgi:hypothetical protein
MIEIIKEENHWNALVFKAEHYDFYHTYSYHHISRQEDELPILLKFTYTDTCIVLPLLVRHITNSTYWDATSVYGYAGILILTQGKDFDKTIFHKELKAFFTEHKIVTVFSRLHPYIDNQDSILNGMGRLESPGNVVFIDLKSSEKEQLQRYNRRLRTYINKSRKLCTVVQGTTAADIQLFMTLYHDNMRRVDADPEYFFSDDYFQGLMSSTEFKTDLLLCLHNETKTVIGGAIFIKSNNIVQYHLSGLDEDYYDLNPIKLLIDEMRIKATSEGYTYFNLGGGRKGKEDSLFDFKCTFSKNLKPFKIWKYVADEEAYEVLVENHEHQLETDIRHRNVHYFPAYRTNLESL